MRISSYEQSPDYKNYQLITVLCNQNTEESYQRNIRFMFTRNGKNEIFSVGLNQKGELAPGYETKSGAFLKSEKISFLLGKI